MVDKKISKIGKTGILLGGVISLCFSYLLWQGILDLEKVFAIMFFIAGPMKIIWSFFIK